MFVGGKVIHSSSKPCLTPPDSVESNSPRNGHGHDDTGESHIILDLSPSSFRTSPGHPPLGMESDHTSNEGGAYPPRTLNKDSSGKTSASGNSSSASAGSPRSKTGTSKSNKSSKTRKTCEICGDIAKSLHFGGLSCDSCKAFFRRSVHNDAYLQFTCSQDKTGSSSTTTCHIDKQSRKSCQRCRFRKCLSIGMETKWVMSEEERKALNKQRSSKKNPTHSPEESSNEYSGSSVKAGASPSPPTTGSSEYIPKVEEMLNHMSAEEQENIRQICEYYRDSYAKIPYNVPKTSEGIRDTIQTIGMFTTILRRFAYFSKLIPEFRALSREDQGNLLKASVLEMVMLRGALSFDLAAHRWPNSNLEFLENCPQLRVEDMRGLVSPELFDMHMTFIAGVQRLQADEPTIMLLLLIVMFYPERSELEEGDLDKVGAAQEKYCELLRKYVNWRYGPEGARLYPKLLTQLANLRQLNDFHTEYHLNLAETEVNVIRRDLSQLNLEPYAQWKIVNPDPVSHGSPQFPAEFSPPIVPISAEGESTNGNSPLPSGSLPHPRPECSQPHPLQQPQQQLQSGSGPIRSSHSSVRAHTRMREAFLRRIPQLIDDPFGPLMSPEEASMMGQRFGGILQPPVAPQWSPILSPNDPPRSQEVEPPTPTPTPGGLYQQFQHYINDPNNQLVDLSNLGNFQNIMDSLDEGTKTRLHSLFSGGNSPLSVGSGLEGSPSGGLGLEGLVSNLFASSPGDAAVPASNGTSGNHPPNSR